MKKKKVLSLLVPVLFLQLVDLPFSLQTLLALCLHHRIQAPLLLFHLCLDLLLLLQLSIDCGLTLSIQNKLREWQKQKHLYVCELTPPLFSSSTYSQPIPTVFSLLISSSCSILKALDCSSKLCERFRASCSSSVRALLFLRDRSAAWICCFLSSADFWGAII